MRDLGILLLTLVASVGVYVGVLALVPKIFKDKPNK